MFVKNIAMAVYGAQYLKEHSVKGKACNKTKSTPRPAIDPTKALAIKAIYEYHLKENIHFKPQVAAEEADNYEDYIRGKISDLRRAPKSSINKKKAEKTESSSSSSSSDSEEEPSN